MLHSVLEPLGVHAQHIDVIWRTMLWVCGFMYVLVLAFLFLAMFRRRRDEADAQRSGKRMSMLLGVWTALVIVGLFGLTLTSFLTDRALVHAASEPHVAIKVTGHQWWWEVEYADAEPAQRIRTANEIHLPVNAQVHIELASTDVIHSFWIPNLHGKRDMIPGRVTEIHLQPTRIGRYRGECAEFCGLQHAHMAFDVIVESQQDYQRWRAQQLATPPPPTDPLQQHGQQVFLSTACSLCHAVSGTSAFGQVGPDLSHVGSRKTLAAGTLPNTPESLNRWLANPQQIKPGNHMPTVALTTQERDALVAYLGALR